MRLQGFRACRSWGLVLPVGGHPHAPGGDEVRPGEGGIEQGVALREPFAAGLGKRPVMKAGIREKAEALEDSAVAELFRVADQEIAVGCFAVKVILHAFGDMIDTAAGFWHGEDIHERARGIGEGDLRRAAPEGFQAEQTSGGNVMRDEDGTLCGRTFPDDAAGCENDNFIEKLFGQLSSQEKYCDCRRDRREDVGQYCRNLPKMLCSSGGHHAISRRDSCSKPEGKADSAISKHLHQLKPEEAAVLALLSRELARRSA
jgi:hypothetical protein